MATDWIMVRIDKAVHDQLERVRASMLIGELMGLRTLEHDPRHRVSLSQVIAQLIAFREKHKARVKRAKQNRRKRSAEAKGEVYEEGGLNGGGAFPTSVSSVSSD